MTLTKSRVVNPLPDGYVVEVDACDESAWYRLLRTFDDATLYQTWSYGAVMYGRRNMSHIVLRYGDRIVAAAQARIATLPYTNIGIAYLLWGPVWRRAALTPDPETFRLVIRALRNEYVSNRGLSLRIVPNIFEEDHDPRSFPAIISEEGFAPVRNAPRKRTLLMDLTPPLAEFRQGTRDGWRKSLKAAERKPVDVLAGVDDRLFESFIGLYEEMLARKKFVEPNSISRHRVVQAHLPEDMKMRILLGRSAEWLCAGHIWSGIGKTPITLFKATGELGLKNGASYILKWRVIEEARERNFRSYNLNGINPVKNPGSYAFKRGVAGQNGREVTYVGAFESRGNILSTCCVEAGERLRAAYRAVRARAKRSAA